MRLLHFILTHSIFVSCCAVALCYETFLLLQIEVSFPILCFVFFSTICSYNFYWLMCKFYYNANTNNFLKNNLTYISLFCLGAISALCFFINSTLGLIPVLISLVLTIMYSMPLLPFQFAIKLRQIGFAKTILLAFTWALVTVMLPVANSTIPNIPTLILFFNRFLFMLFLCIIFDRRDASLDKINNVQSLVSKMDLAKLKNIYYVLLFLYFLTSCLFIYTSHSLIHLLQSVFMVIVLVAAFRKSLQPQSYFFYYFYVDGLMLVSLLSNILF